MTAAKMYYAAFTLGEGGGGVMITGSHLEQQYNGIKMSKGSQCLASDGIQKSSWCSTPAMCYSASTCLGIGFDGDSDYCYHYKNLENPPREVMFSPKIHAN